MQGDSGFLFDCGALRGHSGAVSDPQPGLFLLSRSPPELSEGYRAP